MQNVNLCKSGPMCKCTGKDKYERKMCKFADLHGDECIHYRPTIDGHCDHPGAQSEARDLVQAAPAKPTPAQEAPVLDDEALKEQKEGFIPT